MRLFYAALVMAAIAAIGSYYLFTGRLNLNMYYAPKGITVSHPYEYKAMRTPEPEKFHALPPATVHSPSPLSKYFHEPRHWAPFDPTVYAAKRMDLKNPAVTVTPVPAPEYQPYTPPPAMHTPPPIVPPDYSGAGVTSGSAPKPDDKKSPRPLDSPTP